MRNDSAAFATSPLNWGESAESFSNTSTATTQWVRVPTRAWHFIQSALIRLTLYFSLNHFVNPEVENPVLSTANTSPTTASGRALAETSTLRTGGASGFRGTRRP